MDRLELDDYHVPTECELCGGTVTFKGLGEYKCDYCAHLMYDDYGVVRRYLEKHKGSTVIEISDATGVPQSQINYMLKEERLQVSDSSRVFMQCEGCGKKIKSGRYCPVCEKLAMAAKAKKEREAHKKQMAGYSANPMVGEEGAIRFKRER